MKFCLLLCALVPAFAQTNAGTITGTIFDPSQAVVDGVKVTVHNLATNVAQTATSNSAGVYSLPALEPGTYRITLEKAGFQRQGRVECLVFHHWPLHSSATSRKEFREFEMVIRTHARKGSWSTIPLMMQQ